MTPISEENRRKLEAQLAVHEGKRLRVYADTLGILSVGIGHNLIANPVPGIEPVIGFEISEAQCSELFAADMAREEEAMLRYIPWAQNLDDVRYCVLLNMSFNLGARGLASFVNTLAAVRDGRWDDAAAGMLRSRWARQVGGRAKELAEQMGTGQWQR